MYYDRKFKLEKKTGNQIGSIMKYVWNKAGISSLLIGTSPFALAACGGGGGELSTKSDNLDFHEVDGEPSFTEDENVPSNSYLASFGLRDAESMNYTTTGMASGPGQKTFDQAVVEPVDVLFMQYDSWNSSERATEIRSGPTIQQLKMGSGDEKLLIANKSFGEISPIRGDLLGVEIEMSWLNSNGLPNDIAPTWLSFPNTDWIDENPPDLGRYENWHYLGKHPLYLVEFWDDEYLKLNKDFISDLAEAGWNGVFLDTVLSPLWNRENDFINEPYSKEELAQFTFYALSELRNFIDQSYPGFQLSMNASGFAQDVLLKKPEILELLDGIVIEVPLFYGGNKEYVDFPAVFGFEDQNEYTGSFHELINAISEMESGPAIHFVETVENDVKIFDYIARQFFELKGTSTIRYDSRQRENDTEGMWDPNDYTILPHFYTLVDVNATNELVNGSNFSALLVGLDGDDQLIGSDFDEIFVGGPGNDYLMGAGGNDKAVFKNPISHYDITYDDGAVTVETKSSKTNMHELSLIVGGRSVLGQEPEFSLLVNGIEVANTSIDSAVKNTFDFLIEEEVSEIIFHNINEEYFNEDLGSIGMWIDEVIVDGNTVDLSTAEFLDGQEAWAVLDQYGNLNPGAGRVMFETLKYNDENEHDGKDEMIGVEILSFLDQEIAVSEIFI